MWHSFIFQPFPIYMYTPLLPFYRTCHIEEKHVILITVSLSFSVAKQRDFRTDRRIWERNHFIETIGQSSFTVSYYNTCTCTYMYMFTIYVILHVYIFCITCCIYSDHLWDMSESDWVAFIERAGLIILVKIYCLETCLSGLYREVVLIKSVLLYRFHYKLNVHITHVTMV